jgi:FkbM family methyltransferase
MMAGEPNVPFCRPAHENAQQVTSRLDTPKSYNVSAKRNKSLVACSRSNARDQYITNCIKALMMRHRTRCLPAVVVGMIALSTWVYIQGIVPHHRSSNSFHLSSASSFAGCKEQNASRGRDFGRNPEELGEPYMLQQEKSEAYWNNFFRDIERDTAVPEQKLAEIAIAGFFPMSYPRHAMMKRFPLNPIPIVIETKSGVCLLGSVCSKALQSNSSNSMWIPDPHVRDILATLLLTCSFRGGRDDCFAVDVGSNMGTHTLALLQLGVRVVSIEPQTDLCVSSRIAAQIAGYSHRSHIICGGLSMSRASNFNERLEVGPKNHRYGADTSLLPYKLGPVPLYALERLVSTQRKVHFLKIDTDSIDCLVLQQALDLMEEGRTEFDAIILETWDTSCTNQNLIGQQILKLVRSGYTLFRTLVFERSWDDHKWEYENNYNKLDLPKGWVEEFHFGFNFVLWRADKDKISDEELD